MEKIKMRKVKSITIREGSEKFYKEQKRSAEVKGMRKDMISKISINSMINLMLADVEILEDDENDYSLMQKELFEHIRQQLHDKSYSDIESVLNDINDFGSVCKREAFQIGVKVGLKLMKEL